MKRFILKDIPRYECLQQVAERYPMVHSSATLVHWNMQRTATQLAGPVDALFQQYDLSAGRFTVLMLLNQNVNKPLTLTDLADMSSVSKATMTGLVDGLVKADLVIRTPNEQDRRSLLVQLSDKAFTLIDKILPAYFDILDRNMQPLTENEREQLLNLLSKLQS